MLLAWELGMHSQDHGQRHFFWELSDGVVWASRSSRVGMIGAIRRGWMAFFPEGGGASRCVTTTSPPGFRGKLPVVGWRSSPLPSTFPGFFSSGISD